MNNKNISFNKKLKSYAGLASTLILSSSVADAQIIYYTDIVPDTILNTGNNYDLDLDNNSIVDFNFSVQHGTYLYGTISLIYDYLGVLPQAAGNVCDTATTGATKAHVSGDLINSSLLWDNAGPYNTMGMVYAAPYTSYNFGNFLNQNDRYVAFRFKISGVDHYGWARVDVDSSATQMIIKDYAYQSVAGTQLLAGQISAVHENAKREIRTQIFVNDNGIQVKLINHESIDGFIFVTDILGNVLIKTTITNETTTIPMNGPSGIYFATVTKQDGSSFTKKLFLK